MAATRKSSKRASSKKKPQEIAAPVALSRSEIRTLAAGGAKARTLSKNMLDPVKRVAKRASKKGDKKASPAPISSAEMKNITGKAKLPQSIAKRIEKQQ